MLASRGWTARVHERAPEVREVGAGIYIKNNALDVFDAYGIFAPLAERGLQLAQAQLIDRHGRVMQQRALTGASRVYAIQRQALIEILRRAAEQAGVEIRTGSTAAAADPAGALLLEDGRRLPADLVIAADGAQSRLREQLAVGASYRPLPTIANRFLIPTREITPDLVNREYWSGRYRIGISPCAADLTFAFQVFPQWDAAARTQVLNVGLWTGAFPHLRREIALMAETPYVQHNYHVVRCPRWQKGRVAIIGDAAHALPPTLGQGAGLTLMNAHALTLALGDGRPVTDGLPAWEAAVRAVSDKTQAWAVRYDSLTREWPAPLWFLRPAIIRAFRLPMLNRRMRIADQGLPRDALRTLGGA